MTRSIRATLCGGSALLLLHSAAGPVAAQTATDEEAAVEEIIVTAQFKDEDTLDRKRFSINIRDVIDLEEIQRFPDQDLSETLDRLPGVSIQQSAGRGFRSQFITVRGIQPELNNVTILGQEIISSQGNRGVALDLLPSNAAAVVEIYKTLTPDLDANALGGTVNIIPLSAFQENAPLLDIRAQGGFTNQFEAIEDDRFNPINQDFPLDIRGAGTYRFGPDDQFGIAVSGNYFQQTLPVVLNQCDDWRFAADDPVELPADFQLCEGQRLENGQRRVDRFSVNATAEWAPQKGTRFFISGLYAESEEDNVSTQTEWNFSDAGDFTDVELLEPGVFFNGEGENEKELDVDNETEEFFFVAGGGEYRRGPLFLDASASFSRGESNEDVREWSFDSVNFASVIDFNERFVYGQAVDQEAFFDPSNFIFDEIDIEPTRTVTDTAQFQVNARYDLELGNLDAFIQTGAKFRTTEAVNDREENQFEATPGGPLDGATLADFNLGFDGGDVFGLPLGPVINPVTGEEFVANNPDALFFNRGASIDDSGESDFNVSEDVTAGYALAELRFGQFGIITGVRVEHTETISTSAVFNDVTEILTSDQNTNEYTDVLPSVQLRWEPRSDLVARASFTQSLARPVLNRLAGFTEIGFDNDDVISSNVVADGSVSRGNPFLDPYQSNNFDVTLEWYPNDSAVFALAGFYKDINDPIFGGSTNLTDIEIGGVFFENVSVSQPQNAGEAEILGFEAQANYQASFLPGPLGGLGIRANVAYVDGELRDVPGREGETLRLFQQPDWIATVAPFFQWEGFNARLVWSYTSEQLFNVNDGQPSQGVDVLGDGEFDRFREARFTLGFQVSYRFFEKYEVFFAGENVTEEPFEFYQGVPDNLEQTLREPATYWIGARIIL